MRIRSVEPCGKTRPKPKPIGFPDSSRFCLLRAIFSIFLHVLLLLQTCYYTHFVKIYLALQNINFDWFLTNGFYLGPPQTFFYTVLLQNFEVAPIIKASSENNQDILLSHVNVTK
jgi:hypothetical protein